MKQVRKFVINTLKNDATLQGYLGTNPTRVYSQGVDISPEVLPMITLFDVTEVSDTAPRRDRTGVIQIDIWSNISQLQVDDIYERVLTLLNFAQYQTGYSTSLLRWSREENATDIFESDRRIWHKAVQWRWWAKPN